MLFEWSITSLLEGIKSDHTQTFRFQCFSWIAKNVKTRLPQNVKTRTAQNVKNWIAKNAKTRVSQNVYLSLHQNGLSVEADDREAGGHREEVDCHAALVFIGLTFFQ